MDSCARRRLRRGMILPGALFVLIAAVASQTAFSQYRIIGYYPMWTRSALPAQAVRFDCLTHVMHAFAWPQPDGSIASYETAVDTALINATHRAGRKILLSFGGAAESGAFAGVAADSLLRRQFIANIVARLRTYGYDGADMDWEGPQNASERANEATLLRELRAAFQQEDTSWLITMAIGVTNWSGQWHDFASLQNSVSWFNAMTYDFHGSWSAHAGHNAPLYAPASDYDGSVDEGIRYLHLTRGIPGGKLALGLPFYGRDFQASALYGPKTEPTTDIAYAAIPSRLSFNWRYTWDPVAMVPYLVAPSGTKVTTFDDTTSLALKCSYAKSAGLTGVMIWALGQDLIAGGQPLLEAVGKAMNATTDVTAEAGVPARYVLERNFPNPFNPSTTIRFRLPERAQVRLAVFTILGQEVTTLVDGPRDAGVHDVRFDAAGLAAGVYICRMVSGGTVQSGKILLVR